MHDLPGTECGDGQRGNDQDQTALERTQMQRFVSLVPGKFAAVATADLAGGDKEGQPECRQGEAGEDVGGPMQPEIDAGEADQRREEAGADHQAEAVAPVDEVAEQKVDAQAGEDEGGEGVTAACQ